MTSTIQVPVPNRTQPFWLQERHALAKHVSSQEVPAEADIVIVGSGISGATCAHYLFKELEKRGQASQEKVTVVMLEADALCEGATARNGEGSMACGTTT
jgi:ribulose 1,5-bisphosphate synthetase/thiazole synthase